MFKDSDTQSRSNGRPLDDDLELHDKVTIFDGDQDSTLETAEEMGLDLSTDLGWSFDSDNRWRDEAYEEYYGLS